MRAHTARGLAAALEPLPALREHRILYTTEGAGAREFERFESETVLTVGLFGVFQPVQPKDQRQRIRLLPTQIRARGHAALL